MQTKEKMHNLGRMVKAQLPEGVGYALFVWKHGEAGAANYVSDSQRPDVIEAVKGFVKRNEEGKVVDTPSGN
jgi:hypothetical protein